MLDRNFIISRLNLLAKDIAEELKRRPTFVEYVGLIAWAMKTTSADIFGGIAPRSIEILQLDGERKNWELKIPEDVLIKEIASLNDSIFVELSALLPDIHKAFLEDKLEGPSFELIAQDILNLTLELDPSDFEEILPSEVKRSRIIYEKEKNIRLAKGDVLKIPLDEGGHLYVPAIIITKNRFGTAIGLFDRLIDEEKPTSLVISDLSPLGYPIYMDESLIIERQWQKWKTQLDWIHLFPETPEFFYPPDILGLNGTFGSAESIDGTVRLLTEIEADRLGLLADDYQQVLFPDILEERLKRMFLS